MKHKGCIRWAMTAAALALLMLGWPDAAGADVPPEMVDGTGFDLLAWAVEQFGYPGLAAWLAWQARAAFQRVGTVAVPVEVRLHPDDRALLQRSRSPDDDSDPPHLTPASRWPHHALPGPMETP